MQIDSGFMINLDAESNERLEQLEFAFSRASAYCQTIRIARQAREAGNIGLALELEKRADETYSLLPDELKW